MKRPGKRNANAYGGHGRQAERAKRQSANSQRRGDSRDTANSGPPTANLEKESCQSDGYGGHHYFGGGENTETVHFSWQQSGDSTKISKTG